MDGLVKQQDSLHYKSIGLVQQDVFAKSKILGTIHFFNNHVRPKACQFSGSVSVQVKMRGGGGEYLINDSGGGTYSIFYTF